MYKTPNYDYEQLSFIGFNSTCGLPLDPQNEYRTKANIAFCNTNGIRISGPKLGRPTKDDAKLRKERKVAAVDNTDRIEVERYFSTAKRRNGMGVIKRKREDTSLSTIAMSILVTNIFGTFKLAVEEYENESSDSASNQKKCKS